MQVFSIPDFCPWIWDVFPLVPLLSIKDSIFADAIFSNLMTQLIYLKENRWNLAPLLNSKHRFRNSHIKWIYPSFFIKMMSATVSKITTAFTVIIVVDEFPCAQTTFQSYFTLVKTYSLDDFPFKKNHLFASCLHYPISLLWHCHSAG